MKPIEFPKPVAYMAESGSTVFNDGPRNQVYYHIPLYTEDQVRGLIACQRIAHKGLLAEVKDRLSIGLVQSARELLDVALL